METFKNLLCQVSRCLIKSVRLNFKKVTAVATVVCFILTGVFGQAISALTQAGFEKAENKAILSNFTIPQDIGRITEGKYFENSEIVINIQDMHCHPEVQRNISSIISILSDKYGVSEVYLEGASGEVDTSWLTSIDDKKLREDVVNALINKGEITGAEYYSANSKKPFKILGLEDEKIYKEN